MLSSGVGRMLGRRKKAPAPRKLDPSEQRYQDTRPFEAIRQELMAQGVPATPQLMQSYQDQAASQKATGSGGAMGKRSFTGAGGFAPSLVLKGGPIEKPEMPGGSFYQQTLTGGAPPGAGILSKAARDNPYQWNRTAREGTKSYQSPF